MDPAPFDEFEGSYDDALQRGLRLSGEGKEYFANHRINWTAELLASSGLQCTSFLDFGCGTGYGTAVAKRILGAGRVIGVDLSSGLLAEAKRRWASDGVEFLLPDQLEHDPPFDVAFCNGVFHHIPVANRPAAVEYVRARLRRGGVFTLWENNPWNPGTRLVMRGIPFDRDAITLTASEARRLLREAGFEVKRTAYLFYFPRALAAWRPLERYLTRVPLGAQYCVVGVRR